MKRLYFLYIVLALLGCTSSEKSSSQTDSTSKGGVETFTDTLVVDDGEPTRSLAFYIPADSNVPANDVQQIDSTVAIIVNPTEEQIKKMEEENGDDFATIADDYSYYQSVAMQNLDSTGIKTVNAGKRFLRFVGDGGQQWLLDVRKDKAPEWNMILFTPSKEPKIVFAIEVTREEILSYFK